MPISKDLSTLTINRVIFHDVPQNSKFTPQEPTLAEDETIIDATHRGHLKAKLSKVLGSKSAYPVDFARNSGSPVPGYIRSFTEGAKGRAAFVELTQGMARYLFEQHHGGISPGLLCAIDVTASGVSGIVLMKLEREEGAQLELTQHKGKRAFDMSVLDNLVLTDGTRLFKSAMFLRTGTGENSFRSIVCDSQLNVTASNEMARFWLRFLGCRTKVAPRVATQRFFDSSLQFINDVVPDPVAKNDIYEHLHSQMKSAAKTFAPLSFIQDYVPPEYHQRFREHLESQGVPTTSFTKDLADISGRLKQQAFVTQRGARITVPAEDAEIVKVTPDQIIVNDALARVDRK